MSAEQSQRQTGSGRAAVLIAVLIYPCSFAAAACEYKLLRLEGGMVLMNLEDVEVQRLGGPSGSANFRESRDVEAWRGQSDEPLFAFLRLGTTMNWLYAFSLLQLAVTSVRSWEREHRLLYS